MTFPVALPTGLKDMLGALPVLVLERVYEQILDDVWRALTDPSVLEGWIGTWTGDPDDGHVQFRMTAESPDAAEQQWDILECVKGERLVVRSAAPEGNSAPWVLELDLAAGEGGTHVLFKQEVEPPMAEFIGPGWEFYLDRLGLVLDGRDVAEAPWEHYFPAFCSFYKELFLAE